MGSTKQATMARRVTRDRVPERKEIILWTHADKTRHAPPGIIPPGTEFAQMRPKKLRPNFSGKQGAPTTQDLQNIDQFLAARGADERTTATSATISYKKEDAEEDEARPTGREAISQ